MFDLTREETSILQRLTTPSKIQDFLDTLPINFEKKGETYMSVRRILREKTAHCLEGAFVAGAALLLNDQKPLILDLRTTNDDEDHVVALYKKHGYWGAISKTNHASLRFRDPVYRTIRELVLSYFHEYFLNKNGKKTLREYSRPINLKRFGTKWLTSEEDLFDIAEAIDSAPHLKLFPKQHEKYIRNATLFERESGKLTEWKTK